MTGNDPVCTIATYNEYTSLYFYGNGSLSGGLILSRLMTTDEPKRVETNSLFSLFLDTSAGQAHGAIDETTSRESTPN